MNSHHIGPNRREFLGLTGAGCAALVLASCSAGGPTRVGVGGPEVQDAERRRQRPGSTIREVELTAAPATIDLGGRSVETWAYGGSVPGPEIRLRAGDMLRARVTNRLPEPTTIHWHGLALRNDMDGVPGLTQTPIAVGADFTYEFIVPEPGTFWFHPHFGLQLDRGLYAPLIVEDPAEPGRYDREIVVVLDDWLSGAGPTPEETLKGLRENGMQMGAGGMGGMQTGSGGGTGGMSMAQSPALGGDAGDVVYPLFVLNGKQGTSPVTFDAKAGERIRLRILNVGGDTAFRVALGGHRLTVTHTDGFPVEPVTVDTLLIGMSERYDVTVTAVGGVFPLVAVAEGKGGQALAVLRSASGQAPPPDVHPVELDGRLLQLGELRAAPRVALAPKKPDRTHLVELGGPGKTGYRWTINGKSVDKEADVLKDAKVLEVGEGQRVRLVFDNQTTMFHPMHLHGHTFQVVGPEGAAGPRKDSMILRPNERIAVDFDADNPGQWLIHCHNLYHQSAGMHSVLSYVR